jgi:hypothetical protein
LLRELALFRLQLARSGLIPDEQAQLVIHVSRNMATAREVAMPAFAWAKRPEQRDGGWRVLDSGTERSITDPVGGRYMLLPPAGAYAFSAGLAFVDEAWDVPAADVDNGIEPTQVERGWPQLALLSTAHPKATSLVPDRRRAALAGSEQALIIEWSTPESYALEDRAGWRLASPNWSAPRERMIARAHARMLEGSTQGLGDLDPVEAFRAQWLNRWPDRSGMLLAAPGEQLLPAGVWAAAELEDVPVVGPVVFAVEDHGGWQLAIAAAGRTADGRIGVEAYPVPDRRAGLEWIRAHGAGRPGSRVIVGVVLQDAGGVEDVGMPVDVASFGHTRAALAVLRQLVARGVVAHARSGELAGQVAGARVMVTASGLRMVSPDRWDLVRAAAWAIAAVDRDRLGDPHVW